MFDLSGLGQWLKSKKEDRERIRQESIEEKQWLLVREIADALSGKRIVDDGDKEVLGL